MKHPLLLIPALLSVTVGSWGARTGILQSTPKPFPRYIRGFVLVLICLINTMAYCENGEGLIVPAFYRSYFAQNSTGNYILKNNKPFPGKTDEYTIKVSFSPKNTAFFVIDPWNNMPSNFLNEYYGKITNQYLLPLINLANKKGYRVYIFTNNCKSRVPQPYSCSISKRFYNLAESNPNVTINYWQGLDRNLFTKNLKKVGIRNIIYTGYASNMCVIQRPTGMASMLQSGFSLYFIPKASAAVELTNTWQKQTIHKAATEMISQSLAKIIDYKKLYSALKAEVA